MADLSQLSDTQLMQLYQLQGQESNNAPDSSTIQSPKGASGNMQVMPATSQNPGFGVKPSNGTPQDTAREGQDYYLALSNKYKDPTVAAIAYNWGPGNTDKWLASGADLSKVPNETLKYAYNFNKASPGKPTYDNVDSPTTDVSKMSDADLQKAYAAQQPQPTQDAAQQRANAFLKQTGQGVQNSVNQVQGAGEALVNMGTGMVGQVAGGLHSLYDLATGNSAQATADISRDENALTYQPRTPEGKSITAKVGQVFGGIQGAMEQGAQDVMGAIPFVGEDLAKSPFANEVAKTGADVVANIAPFFMGGLHGEVKPGEMGVPADSASKLAPAEEAAPVTPEASIGPTAEQAFNETPTPYRQYFEQPSLFDQGTEGMQPEGPTLAGSTAPEAFPAEGARGSLSNARQMDLQLDNQEPISVGTNGEAMTADQAREVAPFRDLMQQRVEEMKKQSAQQLDIFGTDMDYEGGEGRVGDYTNRVEGNQITHDLPRSLSSDEFESVMQDLNEKDGTRFRTPDPADPAYGQYMDAAYSKYLDMVRDDQGGLFDRPSITENFAKAAVDAALERRVIDHPTVKANQAALDHLMAQDQNVPGVARETRAAADRLEKSQENIRKYFEPTAKAAAPFYAKDGTVHMYTFGYLPEMMKSIGAILKGVHGVVFKTLDKMIPSFKNLDTPSKIMGQGIKDFVNKQATRDWSQTVNAKPIDQMSKVPGLRDAVQELNPHAQDELSPQELKTQFNSAPDLSDSKVGNMLRNNLLQGGLMLSDFSRHPLVKYVTDGVAKAFRNADRWNRENLLNKQTGLGPMMKQMSSKDFTEIRSLMEANEGIKEFGASELKNRGFNDKQIEYYNRSLELQKEALSKFNDGRVRAGLSPVDARIGHIAGYFTGDFKQIVKDSSGRVVAVLGHNNRFALGTIAKRFQELHPDGANLDMGKPTLNKNVAGGENTFTGFMNILNELSKTNADVSRIVQAYRDVQMANTNKLSQMANRGKFKSGPENRVGGAEGQKLWQSMEQNAKDGGKQQLKYLESVNRWSEFQQSIAKSEDFIKDPEVNAPNAKAVSQAYLDNQMHRNLGDLNKFTNSFSNGIADITGVGPTQMRQIANLTKTGLLNMFVGLGKFSHSLVTLIQPLIGIPEVNSVLKARGADLGVSQIGSVFKSMMDQKDILQSMANKSPISDPFLRNAVDYARANDTFNTSQFNMGSVTHPSTKLGNALHINVSVPESGTRAFTYMYYARMLKDVAGDSMSDKEIFGTAHNAVQKVMADYNREAGTPIFNKLGFLGDLAKMLTTFKMNQISQMATATKMVREGHMMPMVTMLATSIAASGLRGFMGYSIANSLLGVVSTWATKNGLMKQPTNLDQIVLHMLHGVNKNLADALNFGATSGLGIDMTGSLSHADDIPDDPIGTLLPEGEPIGKMFSSAATLIQHPNKQNAKAAVYDTLPNSMKGIMENQAYTDAKGNYYDPHTGNLVANRSPADQMKRNFSFRPLEESKMRLQAETAAGQNQQLNAVKSEIIKRALSDSDSKSLTPAAMQQYAQAYQKAGGDPQELVSRLVQHAGINKNLNIEQREAGTAQGGFTSAERYQRAQGFK
jgi:hypothetical protein